MMGKYFNIQLKRILRILPLAMVVVAVLFSGLLLVYRSLLDASGQSENNTKVQLALVGDAGDSYLKMGLAAVQSFDASRFSMELVQMEKAEAIRALERGEIAAYVLVPDGFVEAATHGDVLTLEYVSSVGAVGLVTLFKNEITSVIADMVIACQKGMYGIDSSLAAHGNTANAGTHSYNLSLSYANHVFQRDDTYAVRELGIAEELGMEGYLFCGISVLFLVLILLPFAPLYIHQDYSLERMLTAKRRPLWAQVLCEFAVFFLGMILLLAVVLCAVLLLGSDLELLADAHLCWDLVAAVFMITALGFFLYSISSNLIGGVILQFFGGLALCFASGCLYPLYFFPAAIQNLGGSLPTAYARSALAAGITGQSNTSVCWMLLLWTGLFLTGSILVRLYRMKRIRG